MPIARYKDNEGNIRPFPQLIIKTDKSDITIDSALSTTSTNPVQNRVVTNKFVDVDEGLNNIQTLSNIEIENLLSD